MWGFWRGGGEVKGMEREVEGKWSEVERMSRGVGASERCKHRIHRLLNTGPTVRAVKYLATHRPRVNGWSTKNFLTGLPIRCACVSISQHLRTFVG